MRRPVRTRADVHRVAARITSDLNALFGAIRDEGHSPIRNDEVRRLTHLRIRWFPLYELFRRDGADSTKS